MIKVSAANVIVSKGYNDTDAVKFSKNGACAMFRISESMIRVKRTTPDGLT